MKTFIALLVTVPNTEMLQRSQDNTLDMLKRSGFDVIKGAHSYNPDCSLGAGEYIVNDHIFDQELFNETVMDFLGMSLEMIHYHDPESTYVKSQIAQMKE